MAATEEHKDQPHTESAKHVADRIKLFEGNVSAAATPQQAATKHAANSNIQRVVPVGVLVVLFTLYLTTAALQRNYGNYVQQEELRLRQAQELAELERAAHLQELHKLETHRRSTILEKLLEFKDFCTELEIFTKDLRWIDEFEAEADIAFELDGVLEGSTNTNAELSAVESVEGSSESGRESGSAVISKRKSSKVTSHKVGGVKRVNGHRSGQRHSNKSIKIKNSTKLKHEAANKKEQPHKKGNTAEPIIYLFALVFIYLLVKAASDINQHYKSQAKGDKRLRRCSLQSYAQTHKQDRRASKVSQDSPKKSKQLLLMEARSKSVDRYHDPIMPAEYAAKKSEILANLRKYTSLDEHGRYTPPPHPLWDAPLTSEGRQSGESLSLCGAIATSNSVGRTDISNTSPNRRCSVPVSLNYQRQKLTAVPQAAISSTARRTSIAGGHIIGDVHTMNADYIDAQFPEVKRRVRMINRH